MTDREYEIIDALYFTVSFESVKSELEANEEELIAEILVLIEKGWIKCLEKISEKEVEDISMIRNNYRTYNFLASKEGLKVHNSR